MASDRSGHQDPSSGSPASAISGSLAESESVEAVAPTILASLCGELGCSAAEFWRISRRSGAARLLSFWAMPDLDLHQALSSNLGMRLPRGVGLPGRVVASGTPLWLGDVTAGDEPECPVVEAEHSLDSAFTYPILFGEDTIAAICLHGSGFARPAGVDLDLLRTVAAQLGELEVRSRSLADMRRNEAQQAAIVEAALDCIITVDHEGVVVEFNPAAVRTFGWHPSEVIGQNVADVLVPAERRERFARLVERVATMEGADGVRGERIEGVAVRRSGEHFPVELTITRVDVAGPPLFITYLRDISHVKEAEAERERLLNRERDARIAAEAAEHRMSFLARASRLLASSLDPDETLRQIANLVVPRMADWCAIDLVGRDGEIEPAVIENIDPAEVAWAYQFRKTYPFSMSDQIGVAEVIRTGDSVLANSIEPADLSSVARNESHMEELRRFADASVMVVPLTTSQRVVGAMTLLSVTPEKQYQQRDVDLAEDLARRAGLAIENARLYADKSHIATALQRSLLPHALPALDGVDLAVRYQPSGPGYEVGGDFYDVVDLGEGRCVLAVGDVQGKGPEAGALIGLVRHTLRTAVAYEKDPSRVLEVVNRAMLEDNAGRLCTVALVLMIPDGPGYHLQPVCGGHPRPIAFRANGAIEPVGEFGTVLGVFADPELRDSNDRLEAGDALVLFSDGILSGDADAEGLFRHLSLTATRSADSIAESIHESVSSAGGDGLRDDVTLLVVKPTGQ